MTYLVNSAVLLCAVILPAAALADVTATVTLNLNQELVMSAGHVVSSGGDIQWTGSALDFLGGAKSFDTPGANGTTQYNLAGLAEAQMDASGMSLSPLPASTVVAGNFFLMVTGSGTFAKVLVTGQNTTSITLEFDTFGVSAPSEPAITAVLNNYGLIPPGFSNSGIALGALFIIQGSGLASGTSSVSSAAPGLPATLNGATVNVTVGSATTQAAFYYASATQLDLVMPSNTPTGPGTVSVTFNGQTSNAFNITVAATGMEFATYYGTGSGLGIATNPFTGAFYNYGNSIPPGSQIVLWGTGLGADPTVDTTFTLGAFSISGLSAIYIGGIQATIQYQGRSGYPGVNQINITVPLNVPTGCFIPVVGVYPIPDSTGGNISTATNFMTLPIGTAACSDPGIGYSGATLTSLSGQTSVNTGFIEMTYNVSPAATTTTASASFRQYTGHAYGTGSGIVSIGGCTAGEGASANAPGTTTPLNAGAITLSSPNAGFSPVALTGATGSYSAQLPAGFLSQAGGTFQIGGTAGTTAPAVGAFSTELIFPTPLLTWTNEASIAAVPRSQGVTVNWSGGSPESYVVIGGSASSGSAFGFFTCLAPVLAGRFTVPDYVLLTLPATSNGTLTVANETTPTSFTASGLDFAYAAGDVSYQSSVAYQ